MPPSADGEQAGVKAYADLMFLDRQVGIVIDGKCLAFECQGGGCFRRNFEGRRAGTVELGA